MMGRVDEIRHKERQRKEPEHRKSDVERPKSSWGAGSQAVISNSTFDNLKQELASNVEKHRSCNIFKDRTNIPEPDDYNELKPYNNNQVLFPPNIDCTETSNNMQIEQVYTIKDARGGMKRVEQYVGSLQAEIFDFCMRTECKNICKSHYFEKVQTDINEKMRAILIDWLVDVHARFKMTHQTLFLTVNMIDRYLEQISVPRAELQLLGIAALFAASKYEEIYPPDLKDFVKYCDHICSGQQIIEVESHLMLVLNFNLVFTSSYQFYELFSHKIAFDGTGYHLGLYFLYLSTLEFLMVKYRPSIVAMSAIYLANKFLKLDIWHSDLPGVIGSSEQEIKTCALDHFLLVQKARKSSLTAVLRKFAVPSHFHVSQIQIKQ